MRCDKSTDLGGVEPTRRGDPLDLQRRILGADVRVESGCRGRHRIHWHLVERNPVELGDLGAALFDGRDQVGVLWPEVRTGGGAGVVAVARRRRARLEELGQRAAFGVQVRLPDEARADDLAGLARLPARAAQLRAVGLRPERKLPEPRDDKRVADAEHGREEEHRPHGDPGGARRGAS